MITITNYQENEPIGGEGGATLLVTAYATETAVTSLSDALLGLQKAVAILDPDAEMQTLT